MPQTKIATCHYCGTRAALVLAGTERHELSCSSCGAPLHDMKHLKSQHAPRKPAHSAQSHAPGPWGNNPAVPQGLEQMLNSPLGRKAAKKVMKASRKKKKKSGLYHAAKILGDIFD